MKMLNWSSIAANTLSAFCIAAIGINIAGAPGELIPALYVAVITGLLAMAKELQLEANPEQHNPLKDLLIF